MSTPTFDPDRAEPVDEAHEFAEMDSILDKMEQRATSLRSQMLADTFRELAAHARKERVALLTMAGTKFADAMQPLIEDAVDDAVQTLGDATKEAKRSIEEVNTAVAAGRTAAGEQAIGQIKLEKILQARDTRLNERLDALKGELVEAACSAMTRTMGSLPAPAPTVTNARDEDLHQAVNALQAAVEALRTAPPTKRPSYRFTIKRDDFARMADIIATPMAE